MCALQFASANEVKSIYNELDTKNIENKIRDINSILESRLS